MAAIPTVPGRRQKQASARIDARLTPEQKAVIQHAADLQSRSVSDFVIECAYAEAERTIREHEIITLSAQESMRFAELLLDPPAPGERLQTDGTVDESFGPLGTREIFPSGPEQRHCRKLTVSPGGVSEAGHRHHP